MSILKINPESLKALKGFTPPEELNFGQTLAPIMMVCDYDNGEWGELGMVPFGPIHLNPTAKVFHYGQEIFEGMKAYEVDNKGPYLFRPDQNFKRFNLSGQRMAIPDIPEEIFMTAVNSITGYCNKFIPNKSGSSLYIRPFTFATEENLGIRPSLKFKFMVVASPSGSYYSGGTMTAIIERNMVRAFQGGTGAAKTGGNYAASLLSSIAAQKKGYMNTIWLDGVEKKYIEEMSGMNFFAVIDGKLHTPPVSDTILAGITRDSLITLAERLDYKVEVAPMEINQLIEKIKDGSCTEAFACGTAAIITPIELLGEEDGTKYILKDAPGPVSKKLSETLLGIQEGRLEDPEGWRIEVSPIEF